MPVKRRVAKRRLDPAAELAVWESVFDCGRDFFRELGEMGVASNDYGQPDPDAAQEAWDRLGARYLAERKPDHRQPWALKTFGEPNAD